MAIETATSRPDIPFHESLAIDKEDFLLIQHRKSSVELSDEQQNELDEQRTHVIDEMAGQIIKELRSSEPDLRSYVLSAVRSLLRSGRTPSAQFSEIDMDLLSNRIILQLLGEQTASDPSA